MDMTRLTEQQRQAAAHGLLVLRVEPPIPSGYRSMVRECDISGKWWFCNMPRQKGMFSIGEFSKWDHIYPALPLKPGEPFPGGGVVGSVEVMQARDVPNEYHGILVAASWLPECNSGDWLLIIRRSDTEGET